jgi:hypothetical protein
VERAAEGEGDEGNQETWRLPAGGTDIAGAEPAEGVHACARRNDRCTVSTTTAHLQDAVTARGLDFGVHFVKNLYLSSVPIFLLTTIYCLKHIKVYTSSTHISSFNC